jgi:hypothetical protein
VIFWISVAAFFVWFVWFQYTEYLWWRRVREQWASDRREQEELRKSFLRLDKTEPRDAIYALPLVRS